MGLLCAAILLKNLRSILILMLFFSFGALRYEAGRSRPSELIDILQRRNEIQQMIRYRIDTKLADNVYQASVQEIAGIDIEEKVLLYYH
ncbi:MAG TPA: hypothetical protein DHW79_02970, partial [Candidatus Cloacimonas sp.]|nr:hypothetical protein [Candidatus Cloacimonas sp.]